MLPENTIIRADQLSKCYRTWHSPLARLQAPLYRQLARLPALPPGWRRALRTRAAALGRAFYALRDVGFTVRRGESVGIIGRNGAGKSTLLQIITGTLQPTAGVAEVRGRTAALLELGSGFNPDFTGRENVRLNAVLHGLSQAQVNERIEAILAFADIGEFIDQPIKTYSSGMMLRLAFAVIAHIDADILIIDEALAVGDVFFVQKCMRFLREFQERGVLLMVSHDPGAITALCQRALWLDQGRVRMDASPKEVAEAYLEAFFADLPAVREAGSPAGGGKTPVLAPAAAPAEVAPPTSAEPPAGVGSVVTALPRWQASARLPRRDQRLAYLNHTQFRNDLEVFEFDPKATSFGVGGGRIVHVSLDDEAGQPLAWIVGGETVVLRVTIQTQAAMRHPIIGFYVKNQLGQQLFGDNTFLGSRRQDLAAGPGAAYVARFCFDMPILPPGDYCVVVALADGTMVDHVMHHWIHDALAFRSNSSPLRAGGLVGLPMREVAIDRIDSGAPASRAPVAA